MLYLSAINGIGRKVGSFKTAFYLAAPLANIIMGRIIATIIMAFSFSNSYSQQNWSFDILEIKKELTVPWCYFGEGKRIKKQTFTHLDSLEHCHTYKLYNTSISDLYYLKYFDLNGQISSEGTILIQTYKTRAIFGKTKETFIRMGIWKEYDYEKNEIVYLDCEYHRMPGEILMYTTEIKREPIEKK